VTRLAVAGLRKSPYHYSWSEIADRLGVTRQAAQMRYGERTDRGALDRRLLESGLGVSVATLVQVFADHHPGSPAASVCPGCGYRYVRSSALRVEWQLYELDTGEFRRCLPKDGSRRTVSVPDWLAAVLADHLGLARRAAAVMT
jgi:hypothetical protein